MWATCANPSHAHFAQYAPLGLCLKLARGGQKNLFRQVILGIKNIELKNFPRVGQRIARVLGEVVRQNTP
jgi:hypothetical protein